MLKLALPLFHLPPVLMQLLSAQRLVMSLVPLVPCRVPKLASAIFRADNLIIFGLPEVESLPALKNSVMSF